MPTRLFILVFFVMLQPLLPAAATDTAYQWVDENGVTNFSDTPPKKSVSTQGGVKSIDLPDQRQAMADPATDYYSVTNQWKRLYEERIEREKLALEKELVRLERSRLNLEAIPTEVYIDQSPPVIYGGFHGKFKRPHLFRHKGAFHGKHPAFSHRLHRKKFKAGQHSFKHKSTLGRQRHSRLEEMPVTGLRSRCC